MQCPNCGTWVNDGEMYCGQCGTRVQVVPPMPPGIQPLPRSAAKGGLGTGGKIAIVVVIVLLLGVGALLVFSLLGCGGCCFYFGQDAPLEIALDYPRTVKVGQTFTLRAVIHNTSDKSVPINSLRFDDALLKGVSVRSSEPPFQGQSSLFTATSFQYAFSISPGKVATVTFQMQAVNAGSYEGDFTASSDPGSKITPMRLTVTP